MLINTESLEIVSDFHFRNLFSNVSFPPKLTDDMTVPYGYAHFRQINPPVYDPWESVLSEGTPGRIDGVWTQVWNVTAREHTPEEEAQHLQELKTQRIQDLDDEISRAILAGFDYTIDEKVYHFSYDRDDQQNFADAANICMMKKAGTPGLPDSVEWNMYDSTGTLVRRAFTATEFLTLYASGAMVHKNTVMAAAGVRKAAVNAATTAAEINAA